MSEEISRDLEEAREEYEVITSDEVDRVLQELENLTNSVQSENIKVVLEEASDTIYDLIYEEEEGDPKSDLSESEAA